VRDKKLTDFATPLASAKESSNQNRIIPEFLILDC
jgi:hypothetical protein